MSRSATGEVLARLDISPVAGSFEAQPYAKGTEVVIFIRPENETGYGEWETFYGIADPEWTQDSEVVYHDGEQLFDGDDVILDG